MRIPNDVNRRAFLVLFCVMGIIGVCGGLNDIPWAQTEPLGCSQGHHMKPGDTCTWTIEGDDVEIHVDAAGCALVTSKNYRMRYAHPGPRLCPGGPEFSTQGLSPIEVADTIVASTSEAPLCGVMSISRPSVDFNGTDIRVWPGLDLEGLMVRWSGAHWFVEETPTQEWHTPKQLGEVPSCNGGRLLRANDVCRRGEHVALVGRQAVRVDVWEDRKVGPEKWVVDPEGTCHALASMSARPFSSIPFAGLQLVWDEGDESWTVVEP